MKGTHPLLLHRLRPSLQAHGLVVGHRPPQPFDLLPHLGVPTVALPQFVVLGPAQLAEALDLLYGTDDEVDAVARVEGQYGAGLGVPGGGGDGPVQVVVVLGRGG